jgi:hypothetical protein
MRPILAMAMLVLVSACQLSLPGGKTAAPNAVTGDPIAVTTLDAPVAAAPVADASASGADVEGGAEGASDALQPLADAAVAPENAEVPADVPPVEEVIDPALQTPEARACIRRGGRYLTVGGGTITRSCVKPTRDGGDRCTRGTQCDGECLARSGTCAPVTPLFGCNEVLQDDGRRVTLCID